MVRKAAFIGFLIIQVVAIALWVMAAVPFLNGAPLVSEGAQIWSGGAYSDLSSNFRTGSKVVLAAPVQVWGTLLWATLLIGAGGLAAAAALLAFRAKRTWIAVGLAVLGLSLGAAGEWFIATQWSGDTSFPPGFLNVGLLYAFAQAFNLQLFIGFGLLALSTVLVIAGVATQEKPFGFHVVALNWAIVAVVWVVAYLALYVAPSLSAGA